MRFCESEWERIRRRERERETKSIETYQPDWTRESMTIIEKSKRIDFIAGLSHDCLFFFFWWAEQETTRSFYEREVYSTPRTLFEALLFTVDILTMINTFVYFFSRNFFSRPRGRCSIIDFVILGNYSLEERNHRFVGLLIYPSNGSLEVKYWFYWFSFYRNFVPWDKIFINQIILYDDKSHLNIAMK